jgi:F-box protein 11
MGPDLTDQQFGNYRLLRRLGGGGFADVYLGQHVRIATQQAAIKVLHLTDVDKQQFQEEAERTAALRHHHIVRLYDFDLQQGTPFLILEYAPNGSLARHERQQLSLATVIQYLKQIAPALQYAHDHNVIHRDIKPDNILVNEQNELLVSDFGIAVISKTGRTSLQSPPTLSGTPYYMAPEAFRGKTEKASDQYSLAIMVYEWLCGATPFTEGDFIQLGFQHAAELVPAPRTRNPAIPPAVEQVLLKALAKNPQDRYPTIQAFADALEAASKAGQIRDALTIVGVDERGNQYSYSSINAAINDVPANLLIYIPPGTYHESIILNKPVEIIGDGPRDQIIIESSDASCILMQSNAATVRHLTLCCRAGLNNRQAFAVDITQGQLKLTDCDITSDSLACIGIHNAGANPIIQLCVIHDGKQSGVFVYENGHGAIEDCNIFGNALSGIAIREGSNPTIRRCQIHDGKQSGISVYESGQGVIEDCDISGHALSGIEIREGGNPTIQRCRIHDGKTGGVLVYENGQGVIEDCDISGNAYAGIEIKQGANPIFRRCRIHDCKQGGVFVHENGQGVIEECDIFGNAYAGVTSREGGNPRLIHCRINQNGYEAVWVYDKGSAVVEVCDLTGNTRGPWDISADSVVQQNANKT